MLNHQPEADGYISHSRDASEGGINNVDALMSLGLPLPNLGIMAKLGELFGFGVKAAEDVSFFKGTFYSPKVLRQMQWGDFHAFPESVKAFESNGTVKLIQGGDGIERQMLEIPGQYGDKDGVFQFIKEADGEINHRLFKIDKLK